MLEIWKDIPWFKDYQASNLGNVKSLKRWKEKIRIIQHHRNWYCYINLFNWKTKSYLLHRLVIKSFLWENILEVNHKDWNKDNNKLENLEYCTRLQNCRHKFDILKHRSPNLGKFWKDNPTSKKVNQYTKQWEFIKSWDSITDVTKELNINPSQISSCCLKIKSYLSAWWYKWEFKK